MSAATTFDGWTEENLRRGRDRATAEQFESRFLRGYWWLAYQIQPCREVARSGLLETLGNIGTNLTDQRSIFDTGIHGSKPTMPEDRNVVECFWGHNRHCIFWSAAPDGMAFFLRDYEEDNVPMPKGESLEKGIGYKRTVENVYIGVQHATLLALALANADAMVDFRAGWTGLKGRTLMPFNDMTGVVGTTKCAAPAAEGKSRFKVGEIAAVGPAVVTELVSSLYTRLDHPMALETVQQWCNQWPDVPA